MVELELPIAFTSNVLTSEVAVTVDVVIVLVLVTVSVSLDVVLAAAVDEVSLEECV